MKKILAALLSAVMLFAASCAEETPSVSSESATETWRGTRDWTEELTERWFSDTDYQFSGLTADVTWTFYENGCLTVTYDESSVTAFKERMTKQIEPYLRSLVEQSAKEAGLSAEEYCTGNTGLSFDDVIAGAVAEVSLGLDDTFAGQTGFYEVREGNLLVCAEEQDGLLSAEEAIRFTRDGDTMILEEIVSLTEESTAESDGFLFPLTLTRIS